MKYFVNNEIFVNNELLYNQKSWHRMAGFSTIKVKSKNLKIIKQSKLNHELLKRQFLSIPPNITTTKYNDHQI